MHADMSRAETMTRAYIEAIYFTETGDTDQPEPDAELTPLCKMQAYIDCRNFLRAIDDLTDYVPAAPEQMGHDLWLTRNGHGCGFWDRPELYGQAPADLFTRISKAIGSHDAEFIEGETT